MAQPANSPKTPPPPEIMRWFEGELGAIAERMHTGPLLLLGGRGTSKTAVLCSIAETLKEPFHLAGRNQREARHRLAEHVPHAVILIDDLDVLLTPNIGVTLRDMQDLLADLWWHFNNQVKAPGGASPRFAATASIEFQGPRAHRIEASLDDSDERIRWRDSYSNFAQGLHRYALNPWRRGWKEWWIGEFDAAFEEKLGGKLAGLWREVLLDLTGGHPALFGPALERLHNLCDPKMKVTFDPLEQTLVDPSPAPGDRDDDGLELDIRRYVEALLEPDAVRRIRSAIRRLKDSQHPNERAAYATVLQIARDNGEAGHWTSGDTPARRILLEEALAFESSSTRNLTIPGARIRELILETAPLLEPTLSLTDRGDAGELCIRSSTGMDRIDLSGAEWRIFRELHRRKGELVSPAELKETAELADDKRAVTNTIQRLLRKLKPYGLGHLVENQYSKGYRIAG